MRREAATQLPFLKEMTARPFYTFAAEKLRTGACFGASFRLGMKDRNFSE
jgi:hypothetical protein